VDPNSKSEHNEDMRNDHCTPYKTSQFAGWKISFPFKPSATGADTALAL